MNISVSESGVQITTDNPGSICLDKRSYRAGHPLWTFLLKLSRKLKLRKVEALKGKKLVQVDTNRFETQWSYQDVEEQH